jgi:hypothetical protein
VAALTETRIAVDVLGLKPCKVARQCIKGLGHRTLLQKRSYKSSRTTVK